jgi:hypothetical protein
MGQTKAKASFSTETTTWTIFLNRKSKKNWNLREWSMSKGLQKKRNEIIETTNTYLLTFGMPVLPKNIKVGFYHMKIDVFELL